MTITITSSMEDFAVRVSRYFPSLDGNIHITDKLGTRLHKNPQYWSDDGKYCFSYMDEKTPKYRITNPVDVVDNDSYALLRMNKSFFSLPEFKNENFIYYKVIWGMCMFHSQGDYEESDKAAVIHYLNKGKDFADLIRGLGFFFTMVNNFTNQIRLEKILQIKEVHDAYQKRKHTDYP